jgi:hypothetical protein
MAMNLIAIKNKYSIYKFRNESALPDWIYSSDFYSITKTPDELSVVTFQVDPVPKDIICNRDWRILKIAGPLDFSSTGIIAEISGTLRGKNISIFVLSTYDTDYILVKQNNLAKAIKALKENGHHISSESLRTDR